MRANGFEGVPRAEILRSRYLKDYDRLQSRIDQLGDKRKSYLDEQEAQGARD